MYLSLKSEAENCASNGLKEILAGLPCIASRYVVQEKGAKYKPRTEEKARIGVERPFAKLSGGTREIGRNPRVTASRKCRMRLAPCRALIGDIHVPLGRDLHLPGPAHRKSLPRRQLSAASTSDWLRSQYNRFAIPSGTIALSGLSAVAPLEIPVRGEVSDFEADFSSQLGTDSSSRIFQVGMGKRT